MGAHRNGGYAVTQFHPDLARAARFLPRGSFAEKLIRLAARLNRPGKAAKLKSFDGVSVKDVVVPGPHGAPERRMRLYTPIAKDAHMPAMLWIHGGGMVLGSPEQDARNCATAARDLGIVVAAVSYRHAPAHPFPAAPEDCYAALKWLHSNAESLGILPSKIAVAGASAGGGLAAAVVLMAHDRGEIPVAFQLLIYPMIDDRTTLRSDVDEATLRLWSTGANKFGWASYRGAATGDVSAYFAPARRSDLSGLPPTWVGVGTCDLFHDEDVEYARRLNEAGVPCELFTVPGAYHGFDATARKSPVVKQFRHNYLDALRRNLLHS